MTFIEHNIMILLKQLNPNCFIHADELFSLSSLEYLSFLVELEKMFQIEIEDAHWADGSFQSIHQVAQYIESLGGRKNVELRYNQSM